MPYCDLLRMTMLLSAGAATILAAITVVAANRNDDTTTLLVAGGWWTIALIIGFVLGRPARAAEAMRGAIAKARSQPMLPTDNPGRVALARLWPLGAFALVAGGLGIVFPGVAAIGAGYGLAGALAWRSREAAVHAIEERDGVRFYVEPGSTLEPVTLIRTPGLKRGRDPTADPPLPPASA
jgi:hypothetical protein